MGNEARYFTAIRQREALLDGDMTRDDIVEALEQLRFEHGARKTLRIDVDARDFLVNALTDTRHK